MKSVELFAGCGGLALGLSRLGIKHSLLAEFDVDAVSTVEFNKARGIEHVGRWPIKRQDVREIDWSCYSNLALISGGPPCQPFGIGGKKRGHEDVRDMWPEAIRAIREARPSAFLFENVRNLAGPKFSEYLDWIVYQLKYPSEQKRRGESHISHLTRLRSIKSGFEYDVVCQVVNAANFGAPQSRFRVLIMGIDAELKSSMRAIEPTHSKDRLLWDQYVSGEYWRRHGIRARQKPSAKLVATVERLKALDVPPAGKPWVTLRDAIVGLGEPNGRNNHLLQVGARVYPGHTGSALDMPAKALKAGDHGVPGGENMLIKDSGAVRYFTVREAARLVGLPDDYQFPRSWSESMRQLGNAVPVALAEAAGRWILDSLSRGQRANLKLRKAA